jgi:hypothetical protein
VVSTSTEVPRDLARSLVESGKTRSESWEELKMGLGLAVLIERTRETCLECPAGSAYGTLFDGLMKELRGVAKSAVLADGSNCRPS